MKKNDEFYIGYSGKMGPETKKTTIAFIAIIVFVVGKWLAKKITEELDKIK